MNKLKVLTLASLQKTAARLHKQKKKIVFTNGAFDILHAGHVQYLEKARSLGDVLILGINTDASVRSYKGPHRPVNSEKDRLAVLAALSCVDYVVLFSDPTPLRLILASRPDVLVKGADWKTGDIVGGKEVLSWGGKVKRITFLKGRSTTGVIEKILAHPEAGQKINRQISDWRETVFKNFRLYAVSDLKQGDSIPGFLKKAEAVYRGGADIIQLRGKNISDKELAAAGIGLRRLADRYQKLFFVNDRLDIALACHADGLHIGQDDLPVPAIRGLLKKAGHKLYLGKSTHSLVQARKTAREEVDYIGVGPVFTTPTKPGYIPVGLKLVRQAAREIKKPFVAIGGINESNLKSVLDAGAVRVAVVRAVFDAKNPAQAAHQLSERIYRHER